MSGQKIIERNRAPRVHIAYDVDRDGVKEKVELPFVVAVMSDLSGKSKVDKQSVSQRKLLEFDGENFNSRMKAIKPRVAFSVPNTLTGEGNLSIDLEFENMEDFSPAAVARKVDSLKKLLEARESLLRIKTMVDGKEKAEQLLSDLLNNPELMKKFTDESGGTK